MNFAPRVTIEKINFLNFNFFFPTTFPLLLFVLIMIITYLPVLYHSIRLLAMPDSNALCKSISFCMIHSALVNGNWVSSPLCISSSWCWVWKKAL